MTKTTSYFMRPLALLVWAALVASVMMVALAERVASRVPGAL